MTIRSIKEYRQVDNAWLLLIAHFALAIVSAGHALLYKRDPRSALGWIAVSLAYPILGPLLYYLFGINRLRTRAHQLKGSPRKRLKLRYERPEAKDGVDLEDIPPELDADPVLSALARSSAAVTHRSLSCGNLIQPFFEGETAYAAMLQSIDRARHSVCLATYIFDTDNTGRAFVESLAAAQARGVEVRVLLDGIGEFYSFPRAGTLLKRRGVKVARFVPPRVFPPAIHINLRNHRKLLVVDGGIGFTGGMNIGDRHLSHSSSASMTTADIHFQVEGPILEQMQAVFNEDWFFVAGGAGLPSPASPGATGTAICRAITDGPNEDLGKLAMIMTGAVALARERVAIMTPYFLPPPELINALQAAALRGVDVSIVLPGKSNQPLAHWAARNMLWELLQYGVRIYYQPAPFAHSKLLLIDDSYAHIGSANIDPRSLRLNFELVLEVFQQEFVAELGDHYQRIKSISREESLEGVDGRPLPVRIRDATAWLFSPYL
ncbi:MAG: cardiolipin synthase [Gammaproteobacteria bacterium]|jgi:cardiolipin synthase|nr:cardiolipin synthase [Gammaproteobacteria bacterium]